VGTDGIPGYGLFSFSAPADAGGTVGQTDIILTQDGKDTDAYSISDGSMDGSFSGAGTTDANAALVFYASGSGVFIQDANFIHTDNLANNARLTAQYVSRNDINATVAISGWVVDDPTLVYSPGFGTGANQVTINTGPHPNYASATLTGNGRMIVTVDETGDTGSWDGVYTFYVSWLFDNGCETGLSSIGPTGDIDKKTLDFNVVIGLSHASGTPLSGNKRVEGARVYFKKAGTAERFLLGEVSLIDGVKGALDSTFVPWHDPGSNDTEFDLETNITFDAPPEVYTYASLNGYYANEVYTQSPDATGTQPLPIPLRYRTAIVGSGGIVFIGNVLFDGKHMPDSMMFSMPGKPGIFPKYNRFDSPSSDGSSITVLAAFKDTILQFKENGMYVINVSNPQQFYAQASYRDCGVFNPCQVFTTSFGVLFVNSHGCFIYDGQKVISLTSGKFDWAGTIVETSPFDTDGTSNDDGGIPCIGYDPRSQRIIILVDISDDSTDTGGLMYDMTTKSWSKITDVLEYNRDGDRHTNFLISPKGFLTIKRNDTGGTGDDDLQNYNHTPAADQDISYITKDMDFGLPSQTKKIFKVYVTYFSDDSTVPTMTFGVDGDTTPTEAFDSGAFASSGGLQTTAFTVNDAALTGIKSLSLKIDGTTDLNFEIQDISILYRVRPIK